MGLAQRTIIVTNISSAPNILTFGAILASNNNGVG